jgi:glycosidase
MSPHRTAACLTAWALACLWLAGCPADPPEQPCDRDCGAHGRCAIRQGREICVCDAGYQGERCQECAPGFLLLESACQLDPCTPNPCREPLRTRCSPIAEGLFDCGCEDGAQDHDGDGRCLPTCEASLDVLWMRAQPCDDSSGLPLLLGTRTCSARLSHDPGSNDPASLYVRGEFNHWDLSRPMTRGPDGIFRVDLPVPPGEYGYKFFIPDGDHWFEDPDNPYHKWVDGERNSRLRVPDCQRPVLWLLGPPDGRAGRARFQVQYLDGAGAAGLGPTGVRVSRDGAPLTPAFQPATGVVRVDEAGLPPGKHLFRLEAADAAGRPAEPLSVPVWVAAGDAAPAFDWRDAALYFVLTDRFLDGDPGNNAPVAGVDPRANWHGGDFAGLGAAIESGYFESLGVNALWLSSISQNTAGGWAGDFGRLATGYHSYWPVSTGWTEAGPLFGVLPVDPHFGTLDELRSLVRLAQSRGLRVLVDLVANHVHQDSPLWQANQAAWPAWFHLPGEVCQEIDWARPVTCWFAPYLPDLDHRNPEVLEILVAHALWLVEEIGVDGFRLDAVKHMIDDVVLELRARIQERLRQSGQRFYLVGETFTGEGPGEVALLKRYIGPDKLDGQFDFPLYWQVLAVLLREERDLGALAGMVRSNDGEYGDFAVMSTFLGNHDVCRALSHADGRFGDMWCNGGKQQGWDDPPGLPGEGLAFQRLRLAWTFLLTSPGVPLVYYGDELGLPGAGDPDNRRPMLFGAELSPAQRATLGHAQRLLGARAAHPALRRGERLHLHMDSDALLWAYALRLGPDAVVVVLNRAGQARARELDLAALGLAEGTRLEEILGGGQVEVSGGRIAIELPGRGSGVWVERSGP